MKIYLYFIISICLSFFDLKGQNYELNFTNGKDKYKIGSSLSISSENKTNIYNLLIEDQSGQLIIEINHQFNNELIINLDDRFKPGNYTIYINILNAYSSDLPFTIKKKGSVGALIGIIGGIGGVAAIIFSSSSNGKANPPLPEPPLPGGG